MFTLCKEALIDAPSCPGALDVLSQYYMHLACLHAQNLAQLQQAPLPGSAADISKARAAAQLAVQSSTTLLNHLLVSDPIRTMYWNHRQGELEALLASLGMEGADGPAAGAGV